MGFRRTTVLGVAALATALGLAWLPGDASAGWRHRGGCHRGCGGYAAAPGCCGGYTVAQPCCGVTTTWTNGAPYTARRYGYGAEFNGSQGYGPTVAPPEVPQQAPYLQPGIVPEAPVVPGPGIRERGRVVTPPTPSVRPPEAENRDVQPAEKGGEMKREGTETKEKGNNEAKENEAKEKGAGAAAPTQPIPPPPDSEKKGNEAKGPEPAPQPSPPPTPGGDD